MSLQTIEQSVAESPSISEQLADALRYLAETAPSGLEKMVFWNAQLLCRGILDQKMEASASTEKIRPLVKGPEGDLLPALQYLQEEARRHDLQVVECILIATISLWMIAEDVEMLRRRHLRDEEAKSHH